MLKRLRRRAFSTSGVPCVFHATGLEVVYSLAGTSEAVRRSEATPIRLRWSKQPRSVDAEGTMRIDEMGRCVLTFNEMQLTATMFLGEPSPLPANATHANDNLVPPLSEPIPQELLFERKNSKFELFFGDELQGECLVDLASLPRKTTTIPVPLRGSFDAGATLILTARAVVASNDNLNSPDASVSSPSSTPGRRRRDSFLAPFRRHKRSSSRSLSQYSQFLDTPPPSAVSTMSTESPAAETPTPAADSASTIEEELRKQLEHAQRRVKVLQAKLQKRDTEMKVKDEVLADERIRWQHCIDEERAQRKEVETKLATLQESLKAQQELATETASYLAHTAESAMESRHSDHLLMQSQHAALRVALRGMRSLSQQMQHFQEQALRRVTSVEQRLDHLKRTETAVRVKQSARHASLLSRVARKCKSVESAVVKTHEIVQLRQHRLLTRILSLAKCRHQALHAVERRNDDMRLSLLKSKRHQNEVTLAVRQHETRVFALLKMQQEKQNALLVRLSKLDDARRRAERLLVQQKAAIRSGNKQRDDDKGAVRAAMEQFELRMLQSHAVLLRRQERLTCRLGRVQLLHKLALRARAVLERRGLEHVTQNNEIQNQKTRNDVAQVVETYGTKSMQQFEQLLLAQTVLSDRVAALEDRKETLGLIVQRQRCSVDDLIALKNSQQAQKGGTTRRVTTAVLQFCKKSHQLFALTLESQRELSDRMAVLDGALETLRARMKQEKARTQQRTAHSLICVR
ncbi:MAG: hypothetical protein MHM6MM_004031 [Cercozoa sp. M6MM]